MAHKTVQTAYHIAVIHRNAGTRGASLVEIHKLVLGHDIGEAVEAFETPAKGAAVAARRRISAIETEHMRNVKLGLWPTKEI